MCRPSKDVSICGVATATHADPIGKAFNRVDNGHADNVACFHPVFIMETESGRRGCGSLWVRMVVRRARGVC